MKKLSELTSGEISTELLRAGQAGSEAGEEQENILRLSTFLMERGLDPLSFEFETGDGDTSTADEGKVIKVLERKQLIEKVVKLERYFSSERGL